MFGYGIYFFKFAKNIVDLYDAVSLEYEGYNGSAKVSAKIDLDKLKEQIKDEKLAKDFINNAKLKIKNDSDLSNGDNIEIEISISETFLNNNKLKIKDKLLSISASGIEDSSSLDLSKYIVVSYTGFNKHATAKVKLDSKLKDEIGKDTYKELAKKINLEIKDNKDLENGKELEIKVTLPENFLKENGLTLKSDTINVSVTDLKDGTEIDAFASMKVSISGMSPNITINITNESTDEFIKTIKYTPSKTSGISNGETIKITASDWDKELADKKALVLKSTTIDYKIESQAAYISKVSEITDNIKNTIKTNYIEKAKSKSTELISWNDKENTKYRIRENTDYKYAEVEDINTDLTMGTPEFVSLYLLTKKEDSNSNVFNKIIGIVKIPYTSSKTTATYNWYVTVIADNFSLKADGSISENAVYSVELDNGKDQDSAYQKWINSIKDTYTVENVPLN